MRIRPQFFHVLLAGLVAVSLAACDQSSQNLDFEDGSNLTVNGPEELTVPNYDSTVTGEYQIRAFTVEQDYEWSVEGATLEETRREGENAIVSTSEPSDITVTVTTTIDGEEYSGTAATVADYPSALDQADKYNLNVFSSVGSAAGLTDQLRGGLTAFAPSDASFLAALDENGNGELEDAEIPAPGVLASVLRYHAALDSLTSSEINDGDVVPSALHPAETLSFGVSGDDVSVNGIPVEAADIATAEGAVLHKIGGVLLPASVVSINPQDVIRDTVDNVDSVAVEGTYVEDGGFVALHDAESGDIIGNSEKLDAGFHGNEAPLLIELDDQLSDTTDVVAMPHVDDPEDGLFSPGTGDEPYVRGSSSIPVTDTASVAVP